MTCKVSICLHVAQVVTCAARFSRVINNLNEVKVKKWSIVPPPKRLVKKAYGVCGNQTPRILTERHILMGGILPSNSSGLDFKSCNVHRLSRQIFGHCLQCFQVCAKNAV
jgi:hypothetical protein